MAELNFLEILRQFEEDEHLFLKAIFNFIAAFEDDEDEGRGRELIPWVKIFVDVNGWRRLGDPTFKIHFRMSRIVFEKLVTAVGNHLIAMNRLQRMRRPVDLMLTMALWILMTPDTFRSTALKFYVSPGVVFYHYACVIKALREMGPQYVKWPSVVERAGIKQRFFESYGYPGVVGCIDGTHSYITAPLEERQAYVNRHHSYSILTQDSNIDLFCTQAVVDDSLLVRDLYVGEAGSLHDSRVFRRSPLSRKLLEDRGMLLPDEHILGDGAYILTDKVITPYADNGVLTAGQRLHNRIFSRCRSTVERAFGLCKGKFRSLKLFQSRNVGIAVDHIVACFVLHNFIILSGEIIPVGPAINLGEAAAGHERVDNPLANLDEGAGIFPNANFFGGRIFELTKVNRPIQTSLNFDH